MSTDLHPVLSIRLFREEKCYGAGIHQLLQLVEEHHSLRAAAQTMGMAYSKAWTIVRQCEAELGFALLHSTTGGRHGGGATVTDEAKAFMAAYEQYCTRLRCAADELFRDAFQTLL